MAYHNWKDRPLENPMAKVEKRTYGDGRVRYVVMAYHGVTLANFEEVEDWREHSIKRHKEDAAKIASRIADQRRAESYTQGNDQ